MSFKVHDFEMVTIFLVERDFLFSYLGFNFIYRIELPDSHQNTLCMHYKNIFTTQLYLSTKCKKKIKIKCTCFFGGNLLSLEVLANLFSLFLRRLCPQHNFILFSQMSPEGLHSNMIERINLNINNSECLTSVPICSSNNLIVFLS